MYHILQLWLILERIANLTLRTKPGPHLLKMSRGNLIPGMDAGRGAICRYWKGSDFWHLVVSTVFGMNTNPRPTSKLPF